jgi:hypothetical protein
MKMSGAVLRFGGTVRPKGRLKVADGGFQTALFLHQEADQQFFEQEAEDAETEDEEEDEHAEFAGIGFFAEVVNDKAEEDNEDGEADTHCPGSEFRFAHGVFSLFDVCCRGFCFSDGLLLFEAV